MVWEVACDISQGSLRFGGGASRNRLAERFRELLISIEAVGIVFPIFLRLWELRQRRGVEMLEDVRVGLYNQVRLKSDTRDFHPS